MNKILFFFFASIFSFVEVSAQVSPPTQPPPAPGDSLKLVNIIKADRYGNKRIDSLTSLQVLVGNVILKQDSTLFYCDSAVYNDQKKIIEAFGNVHINDKDSVHTYSQYLLYHVDTKIANLRKKVKLTDNKTTLYTEELNYDMNTKIGDYSNGGRVENGESVLTSKQGIYYTDLNDIYFKKNVRLVDPKYKLETDSMIYNTKTQIATFIDKTVIIDSANRKITTKEGWYDLRNRRAVLSKRPVIVDGGVHITADSISTDDSTGINILKGRAVYSDSAQGTVILSNYMLANREEGEFLATQHPLMIIKQDEDSIFVTADTLFSGKLSRLPGYKDSTVKGDTIKKVVTIDANKQQNDSTDRYFRAWHNVRIFSDSLQAVSDSLLWSGKDSVFQLFTDPIVWASDNQITGDTIYLYTKNKKPDRLFVFENGLMINKAGESMYNQIRGNRINGYFVDGAIDYMRAKGNAESIYYVKDDAGYLIGINKAAGDIIDMRFENKELKKVIFISEVKGTMYPVRQISDEEKILRGFQWYDKKRPKSKFELFGD